MPGFSSTPGSVYVSQDARGGAGQGALSSNVDASSVAIDYEQQCPSRPGARTMVKVGRNDTCPCGSGKKYKRCCLPALESGNAERVRLQAERDLLLAERDLLLAERDDLAADVQQLIDDGRLDDAEAMSRQLEDTYPDDTICIEQVGRVHEAKGSLQTAADHYRRAVARLDELGEGRFCDCCRARMVKAVRRLDPNRPAPPLGRDPQ